MGQTDFNQSQDYYGEYKQGIFGNAEQIFISFSAQTMSARGYVLDLASGKFEIAELSYPMNDVVEVDSDKMNGKPCTIVRTKGNETNIYLPGLTVMTPMVKNTFNKFKDLAMQLEAEKFKVEAATTSKSSSNLSLEEEIAEFKEKVNKLKIMKENGVLSPIEYQDLKAKLMDLYH